jgi:ribonuclease HI
MFTKSKKTKSQKYYAVKIGINPGIYTSWEECKEEINGFSGAKYKSFKTEQEAQQYLNSIPEIKKPLLQNVKTTNKTTNKSLLSIDPSSVLMSNNLSDISLKRFKTYTHNGIQKYYIFTDGSSQKSHSAYGVYFGNGEPEPYVISPTFIHFANLITEGSKTNNTAELKAIESALNILENCNNSGTCNINKSKEIVIISDSKYAISCITLWYIKWRKNYWINSGKTPVKNRELIESILDKLENLKILGFNISFKHQYAHKSKPKYDNGIEYYLWLGNYMIDYLVQKKVINK